MKGELKRIKQVKPFDMKSTNYMLKLKDSYTVCITKKKIRIHFDEFKIVIPIEYMDHFEILY